MAEQDENRDFAEFDARLARLRPEQAEKGPGSDDEPPRTMNFGNGLQVGIEMLAGIGGGCLIGYGLDRWLDTKPFLLVVFFFFGAAAGMLNAYRHLRRYARSDGSPGGSD